MNTFLGVAADGLRITDEFDHEGSGDLAVTMIVTLAILLGLLGLYAESIEGAFWVVVGVATLVLFRGKASRKLRLNVRQGSLDWFPQSRKARKRRLVAHVGSIGNPYASSMTHRSWDRDDVGRMQELKVGEQTMMVPVWEKKQSREWRLVIHAGAGTIRIGCFETEESAVALGKLIACVLKYGNDPDARRRVLELPGVSDLLGPEKENFLAPSSLPRLDPLPYADDAPAGPSG